MGIGITKKDLEFFTKTSEDLFIEVNRLHTVKNKNGSRFNMNDLLELYSNLKVMRLANESLKYDFEQSYYTSIFYKSVDLQKMFNRNLELYNQIGIIYN